MKTDVRFLLGFLIAGSFAGGMAYATQESIQDSPVTQIQYKPPGSHWYCVSESPNNMQSSGHIGYGHGVTRAQAARRAVEACGRDGGFECGAPECWPE